LDGSAFFVFLASIRSEQPDDEQQQGVVVVVMHGRSKLWPTQPDRKEELGMEHQPFISCSRSPAGLLGGGDADTSQFCLGAPEHDDAPDGQRWTEKDHRKLGRTTSRRGIVWIGLEGRRAKPGKIHYAAIQSRSPIRNKQAGRHHRQHPRATCTCTTRSSDIPIGKSPFKNVLSNRPLLPRFARPAAYMVGWDNNVYNKERKLFFDEMILE
jgi:hypothetical protein